MQDYFNNPQNYDTRTEVFGEIETIDSLCGKGWILIFPVAPYCAGVMVLYVATLVRRKKQEPTKIPAGTLVTLPNGFKVEPLKEPEPTQKFSCIIVVDAHPEGIHDFDTLDELEAFRHGFGTGVDLSGGNGSIYTRDDLKELKPSDKHDAKIIGLIESFLPKEEPEQTTKPKEGGCPYSNDATTE